MVHGLNLPSFLLVNFGLTKRMEDSVQPSQNPRAIQANVMQSQERQPWLYLSSFLFTDGLYIQDVNWSDWNSDPNKICVQFMLEKGYTKILVRKAKFILKNKSDKSLGLFLIIPENINYNYNFQPKSFITKNVSFYDVEKWFRSSVYLRKVQDYNQNLSVNVFVKINLIRVKQNIYRAYKIALSSIFQMSIFEWYKICQTLGWVWTLERFIAVKFSAILCSIWIIKNIISFLREN